MKLVVTEKPSVAKELSIYLKASKKCDGYFEGEGYQVTWALGHLICLKEPDEYNPQFKKWRLSDLPIIPSVFELKLIGDKGVSKQFAVIKKLMLKADSLICATDAGREGELIFRYILALANPSHKSWSRLWLSSLTHEGMDHAFKNLRSKEVYDHLYEAARCRNQADWIVGLNGTRHLTIKYGRGKFLCSVGRVQTPVLSMIVKRDSEIKDFEKKTFWEVFTLYRDISFKWEGDRFTKEDQANDLISSIKDHPFHIQSVEHKQEKEWSPLLYDLTELQREMNRKYGLSAADTLKEAQYLYDHKFITYPRTDSRYLSKDMEGEVVKILKQLKQIKKEEIEPLDLDKLPFSSRIINNKKVTDHHAIIPTSVLPSSLNKSQQDIYEAIVTRFISVFYPPCIKAVTHVEGSVQKELFKAKGVSVIAAGWAALYPKKKELKSKQEDVIELPLFQKGEGGGHSPFIKKGETSPPSYYTEALILSAMETAGKWVEDEQLKEALKERGLGTPATRASIIETLIKRDYIKREGKFLKATDKGKYLIAVIQDEKLKSADLTGSWEAKLKKMELGEYDPNQFMQEINNFTKEVIDSPDIHKLASGFLGNCPQCGSEIVKGKKGFGCSSWREGCSFVFHPSDQLYQLTDDQIRLLLQKKIIFLHQEVLVLSMKGKIETLKLQTIGS
ncbi:MAG: DNA topoisomerase 3 [Rhabdochlamydiaceae bacterium]